MLTAISALVFIVAIVALWYWIEIGSAKRHYRQAYLATMLEMGCCPLCGRRNGARFFIPSRPPAGDWPTSQPKPPEGDKPK